MLPFAHYAVLEQCKNVRYFFVLSGLIIMNESRPNSGVWEQSLSPSQASFWQCAALESIFDILMCIVWA